MGLITSASGYDNYIEYLHDQAGGFLECLIRAITKADLHNRRRLEMGFPSHVDAHRLYSEVSLKAFLMQVTPTHPLLKHYQKEIDEIEAGNFS